MREKTFKLLGVAAIAASALVSCSKEIEISNPAKEDNANEIHVNVIATADPDTKTALDVDGKTVLWKSSGEYIAVLERSGKENLSYKKSSEGILDGSLMNFGVTLTETEGYTSDDEEDTNKYFDYYGIYPYSAYISGSYANAEEIKVELKSTQKPTSSSFGQPTDNLGGDILIAKPVEGLTSQPNTLALQFKRIVSVAKMTIQNVNSDEDIVSVSFTAPEHVVAGRSKVNLASGTVTEYGYSNNGSDNVILDYSDESISANSNFTAYFTAWPLTITGAAAGDATDANKFIVTVKTANKTFTKEVTVPAGRSLTFNEGKPAKFSVDFAGIEGSDNAVSLVYAKLTNEEVKSLGYSYTSPKDYTQESGATWTIAAYQQSSNTAQMQLGNADGSNNASNSYIKLPDFTENIRLVNVTLSAEVSGKVLFLATAKDAKSSADGVLKENATKTVTFDVAAAKKEWKTAYLRTDGTVQVVSVEVFAGEDTREQLPAPASVTATLDDTDLNTINVSWTKVAGAASYVVTAYNSESNQKSVEVEGENTLSASIEGLSFATSYTISVYAKPADTATYKDGVAKTAVAAVETGEEPDEVTVTMDSFSAVEGDLDANIHYIAEQGSAGNAPGVYSNVIRIYQNGGTLTVSAKNSKKIISITLKSTMGTTLDIAVDGEDTDSDQSVTANKEFTKNNISASNVKFTCKGTDKNTRLCLSYISVTYNSGNGGSETATYSVNIAEGITNGKVVASKTSGISAGESITLTVTPDSGYKLETLTVAGSDVTSSVTAEGTYTFNMPASDVAVNAEFTTSESGDDENKYYTKVSTITSGKKYILVDGSLIFDGSNVNTTTTGIDASSLITSKGIVSTTTVDAYAVTISSSSGSNYKVLLSTNKYLVINASTSKNGNLTSNENGEDITITKNGDYFRFISSNKSTRGIASNGTSFKNYAVQNFGNTVNDVTYGGNFDLYELAN